MKVSKSGLFLFELIIVIFLFTVSSAVCISTFAKSFTFSTDSENLTVSSIKAETVAEVFKDNEGSAGSDVLAIAKALDANTETYDVLLTGDEDNYGDFTLNLYYDENWHNTDEVNRVYTLTISANEDGKYKNNHMVDAAIKTTSKDKTIFNMKTCKITGNV